MIRNLKLKQSIINYSHIFNMTHRQDSADLKTEFTTGELSRYSRHFALPEVGIEGQKRLKAAKVLIIGVGGLGSPVALYLTAAGVGTIGLIEHDMLDETNLQRQILYRTQDIGKPKVHIACERLKNLNPYVNFICYETPVTKNNAISIIQEYDVILGCTDNLQSRYLINDACIFAGKPNVYGSIFRFEGQVSVFNYQGGPCYRCLFPEPPPPSFVPNCAEAGVIGILPGVIGPLQTTEAVKIILGIGEVLSGRFLLFDSLALTFREMKLSKDETCPVCGKTPTIKNLIDYNSFCGVFPQALDRPGYSITIQELKERLNYGEHLTIVDIREPFELFIAKFPGAIHIPRTEIHDRFTELNPEAEIILICRTGARSAEVRDFLIEKGFKQPKNLTGGIRRWAEEIDTSLPVY
jgi:adenylyltransferase/sulfurtransferase